MIESLKSAAAINATLFAKQGVEPGRDQGQADAAPLRQPEPQMSEAATLSAAIQRLISERDSHKSRAGTQEMELTRLRAVNDELRRQHEQTAALRDHYMRLATEMLTTLRHIDGTIHDLVQRACGANGVAEASTPRSCRSRGACRRRARPTTIRSFAADVALDFVSIGPMGQRGDHAALLFSCRLAEKSGA